MDTSNTLKVRFSYTFSEWASAALFYACRTLGNILQILVLLIALGLTGYHFWLSSLLWRFHFLDDNFWLALVWLGVAIEVKFNLIQLVVIWFRYRRNATKPPRVYEFTFDETGARYQISNDSDNVDVKQAWTQFKRVLENNQVFLLLHKEGGYWAVPKRYFADAEEINTLRDLLKRNVGKTVERVQATG
jgi:hypothetical protein